MRWPHVRDHDFYMKPPSLQLSAIQVCTPGWGKAEQIRKTIAAHQL